MRGFDSKKYCNREKWIRFWNNNSRRKTEEKIEIPKEKIILNSLAYAKELEQIV